MRIILLLLACCTLFSLAIHAQDIASLNTKTTLYSPISLATDNYYGNHNTVLVVGCVVTGIGAVCIVSGIGVYFGSGEVKYEQHAQTAGYLILGGCGIAACGGITALVGGIIARNYSHKYKYGFQLIAPSYNQIGIAYNFK